MTIEDEYYIWLKVVRNIEPYNSSKIIEQQLESSLDSRVSKKKRKTKKPFKSKEVHIASSKFNRDHKDGIDSRLDLHGMTQVEAFDALKSFIPKSFECEKRKILVITGKGNKSEGVLKKMLPLWLEGDTFKKYIDHITQSKIKDGGAGAFYVYLKRRA